MGCGCMRRLHQKDRTNPLISSKHILRDATWKRIQLNTFTRWVRQKLEQVDVTVSDLETDFEEGLKLIRLVEVLSGKSFGRHNKKVIFRHQKLENISLALQFLENEEHIKLVNIDSSAIADRNLKLILGLVWTLILHYSISKQVWDHPSGQLGNGEMSAKEKLLTWLRAKLPVELSVTNFTFDWNDGILLGALVDSCAPDLEVDWRKWLPSQALQSTLTAMRLASDYLGVTALIEPEELISPAVDEKSVMTYLSQFPGAKYTPLLGRLHDVVLRPVVGVSTIFKLQTRDNEDGSYTVTLTPHAQGQHRVMLMYGGVDIPGGTFDFEVSVLKLNIVYYECFIRKDGTVTVTYHPKECGSHLLSIKHDANEEYATVYGLGLLQAVVGEPAVFTVCAKGSPTKELSVAIEGTAKAVIKCHDNKDGTCSVVWIPSMAGEYKVHVKLSGKPVKNSPFVVFVANEDQKRAHLSLEPTAMSEVYVIQKSNFQAEIIRNQVSVFSGFGDLSVSIQGPSEAELRCIENKEGVANIVYRPTEPGIYILSVKFAGVHINGSSSCTWTRHCPVFAIEKHITIGHKSKSR
uniref:BMA-FLN-1, isoform a n=1 Tax=Brugia malayi TaxID=6279 RepID=A0A1I9G3F2_BRUMA|nr:BMA-FLN-1, isoform a [Brugia malayi]